MPYSDKWIELAKWKDDHFIVFEQDELWEYERIVEDQVEKWNKDMLKKDREIISGA